MSHTEDNNTQESTSNNKNPTFNSGQESKSLTHVLIRKGKIIESVSNLNNTSSVESEIARSRGGGELQENNGDSNDSSAGVIKFKEGKLQSETGFFMHFVTSDQKDLPIYDIISLPQSTAYPVSQQTFDSLPKWAKEILEREGHLKCNAIYDTDTSRFKNVQQGWQRKMNPYDKIIQLTDELNGDIVSASYYLAWKHGSEEFSHPESIAQARDIKPQSVIDSIRNVENRL